MIDCVRVSYVAADTISENGFLNGWRDTIASFVCVGESDNMNHGSGLI